MFARFTKEFVRAELQSILNDIENNEEILLLQEVLLPKKYCRQRLSEWIKEYEKDNIIQDLHRRIKDILEMRINKGGLNNKLNANMARFNLSANYGMVEKTAIDQRHSGNIIINDKSGLLSKKD